MQYPYNVYMLWNLLSYHQYIGSNSRCTFDELNKMKDLIFEIADNEVFDDCWEHNIEVFHYASEKINYQKEFKAHYLNCTLNKDSFNPRYRDNPNYYKHLYKIKIKKGLNVNKCFEGDLKPSEEDAKTIDYYKQIHFNEKEIIINTNDIIEYEKISFNY